MRTSDFSPIDYNTAVKILGLMMVYQMGMSRALIAEQIAACGDMLPVSNEEIDAIRKQADNISPSALAATDPITFSGDDEFSRLIQRYNSLEVRLAFTALLKAYDSLEPSDEDPNIPRDPILAVVQVCVCLKHLEKRHLDECDNLAMLLISRHFELLGDESFESLAEGRYKPSAPKTEN